MPESEYQPETLDDVRRSLRARNVTFEYACREIGRMTGAKLSTSDARSVSGGYLSNPMRAAFGLYLLNHDLIYIEGKEPSFG